MRNDFHSGYLMHWDVKKGSKKKNHKYIERIEKNGKYIYFYTREAYEAYLRSSSDKIDKVKNKVKKDLDKKSDTAKKAKSSLLNFIKKGQSTINNLLSKANKKLEKTNAKKVIDRGQKKITQLLNKAMPTVKNATEKLKDTANKIPNSNVTKKVQKSIDKISKAITSGGKAAKQKLASVAKTGQKKIDKILNGKAASLKMSNTKKAQKDGSIAIGATLAAIGARVLITAALTLVAHVASKVIKAIIDANKQPKNKQKQPQPEKDHADDPYKEDTSRHPEFKTISGKHSKDSDTAAVNNGRFTQDHRAYQQEAKEIESTLQKNDLEIADLESNIKYAEKRIETEESKILFKKNESYITEQEKNIAEWRSRIETLRNQSEELTDRYVELYGQYTGYTNNCANCSLTYDLRRRGYDVTAPWNPNGTLRSSQHEWYELSDGDILGYDTGNPKKSIGSADAKAIKKQVESMYPEGAYGIINCTYTSGGGHATIWSIENGEVIIRDPQANVKIYFDRYLTLTSEIELYRTDDKALTDKAYKAAASEKVNAYGDPDVDLDYDTPEPRYYDIDVNTGSKTTMDDKAYEYRKKKGL